MCFADGARQYPGIRPESPSKLKEFLYPGPEDDKLLLIRRNRAGKVEAHGLMADRVQEARKLSIHSGCIASSDGVMKSGQHRDELETREKVVAFEIKDTSVWDYFFTIVIKTACTKALTEEWRSANKHSKPSTSTAFAEQAKILQDEINSNLRRPSNSNVLELRAIDGPVRLQFNSSVK
ncbi:hypothetical protein TWF102_008287 [Orbilia oligospora]|uniref:Uncharacterized protein n=1 Tax=Orbilia oligospora TaxID=2813651 RepID=A0A7C8JC89_ORBOL|nr:hypothetical protein TWF102_008287 [Orbilia oligospora]